MSSIRDSHDSQVAHRMLSARRLKVNELRNRVEELNQQLYEVERENKLLKRQNVMKDRVIDKHEGEDSEVSINIERVQICFFRPKKYVKTIEIKSKNRKREIHLAARSHLDLPR